MVINLFLLAKACAALGISYEILHPTQNLVRVKIGDAYAYFCNYATPWNDAAIAKILKDKDYTGTLLKDVVRVPKTIAFFTPFYEQRHQQYSQFQAIEPMVVEIEQHLPLPLIVKRNQGSAGNHVFLCETWDEVRKSLATVFDVNSKDCDYVALAQECIDIEQEYRAIFFQGKLGLLYEKSRSNATFVGNLSPLHWEGGKANHITDAATMSEIQAFADPVFQVINIGYCGFDIARDRSGRMWLIEINSQPNYEFFVRDNGEEPIINLFQSILTRFK